jgi:metal-sulfur cluster biosynthetic enzyme
MASREEIVEALKTVVDPELFIDIWTLGLVYDITKVDNEVNIKMTFTSPACPAGPYLVEEVRKKVGALQEVENTNVEIVFQPPWQPSDDLKAMLGID